MFAFLTAALVHLAAFQVVAASFDPTTPPDWLIYSYPTTDVVVNTPVALGFNAGPLHVPHDFYGFGYNLSVSTILPNNTNRLWGYTSNLYNGQGEPIQCAGSGSPLKDGSLLNSITFTATELGQHTAIWNVTYGTSDNQEVVNQTSCDPSRLSYQTFIFNATFNVVEATNQNGAISAAYTTVTSDFPSEPTGKIFESSHALSLAPSVTALGLSVLVLISHAV